MLSLTTSTARRLTLTAQRLAGPLPTAVTRNDLLQMVRALGCVQLDPLRTVERTHRLVLWSRVGAYSYSEFDALLWETRELFEYWAHCASIVLTEDYPFYSPMMRAYPWSDRTRAWIKENVALRRYILRAIKQRGPVLSRELEEAGLDPKAWVSTGWTSGRNISRMLDFLWIGGQIMVAGRQGIQKKWDLSERVLPHWTPRDKLSEKALVERAALRALRALGVGTARHITQHFIRGRYPSLPQALAALEKAGHIQRVQVAELPGQWYIPTEYTALLDSLPTTWQPRTTLLSPFDNLICDRPRTLQLFNFDFKIEIYTPVAKRRYGYYVLPILHSDALIGRIDPEMQRATGELVVNAVHAEPQAPASAGPAIAQAVQDLAHFLGAQKISYNRAKLPSQWKKALLA